MNKTNLACGVAFCLGALAPTLVAAHNYTYIEGGFVDLDNEHYDDSGLRIAGSADIAPPIALIGEYADVDRWEQLSAGALFHKPLNRDLDLNLGATLEQLDLGHADDTGYGLRAGLRWRPPTLSGLEFAPEVRYLDVFEEEFASLRIGALFRLAPALDLQGAVQGGDDDRVEVGLRYNFSG